MNSAVVRDEDDEVSVCPPQVQLVWDNLNLSIKHRFERKGDDKTQMQRDWMGSIWIKDRIDLSHMEYREGCTIKSVDDLRIGDMIPSQAEKDYVFGSLVAYFTSRLVERHPKVFKSLNQYIKPYKPHQFQQEMSRKSDEYTGEIFTKSESKMEDLLYMMSEVQSNVHTYKDENGFVKCHERKIVSGDNKTEKNMHHGILRY